MAAWVLVVVGLGVMVISMVAIWVGYDGRLMVVSLGVRVVSKVVDFGGSRLGGGKRGRDMVADVGGCCFDGGRMEWVEF
ncbi:unnamed protein product, partial [Ilex paraguariensis]